MKPRGRALRVVNSCSLDKKTCQQLRAFRETETARRAEKLTQRLLQILVRRPPSAAPYSSTSSPDIYCPELSFACDSNLTKLGQTLLPFSPHLRALPPSTALRKLLPWPNVKAPLHTTSLALPKCRGSSTSRRCRSSSTTTEATAATRRRRFRCGCPGRPRRRRPTRRPAAGRRGPSTSSRCSPSSASSSSSSAPTSLPLPICQALAVALAGAAAEGRLATGG